MLVYFIHVPGLASLTTTFSLGSILASIPAVLANFTAGRLFLLYVQTIMSLEPSLTNEPQTIFEEDSAVTKAEKHERDPKRIKLDRVKGVAPIKPEYLIQRVNRVVDDDAAEKKTGQNKGRKFAAARDEISLCSSRSNAPEFSPEECKFGDECKYEHDLRKYLASKREDIGKCPVFEAKGGCDSGWKCRFLGSHMKEVDNELTLLGGNTTQDTTNNVSTQIKTDLSKRDFQTPKSDQYLKYIDNKAQYKEPPLRPSEKRKIYFGRETPVLAPLTTQGNLPFRRLCVSLGAQATYSEMAMSFPLLQGKKSEWALLRAHSSEPDFGAQIAANKPWQAIKATEIITSVCPKMRVVDLNCGCPIDLVYRTGAGSALLDAGSKLEKMLRGMNAVSGEVPTTVKIRMGTKDGKPTALKLIDRLVYGGEGSLDSGEGPCGVAAITLHGRSRQQRYTRSADWEYIAECATLIKEYNQKNDDRTDTSNEAADKVYFLGNGDCYSHVDYFDHLDKTQVDSVMIARGALIKPWIFEEIEKAQYLDKSASERLQLVEQFVKNGLEVWGSDERGVGLTRRFLLEWLSFAYRYVPIGLLEYLPPNLQDRPPAWKGRNELETLLGSGDYRDWIKIRYVCPGLRS